MVWKARIVRHQNNYLPGKNDGVHDNNSLDGQNDDVGGQMWPQL